MARGHPPQVKHGQQGLRMVVVKGTHRGRVTACLCVLPRLFYEHTSKVHRCRGLEWGRTGHKSLKD